MTNNVKKPVIVAGDFNAFKGDRELKLFLAATGLKMPTVTDTLPIPAGPRAANSITSSTVRKYKSPIFRFLRSNYPIIHPWFANLKSS